MLKIYLKKHKYFITFLVALFIISIIIGLILFKTLPDNIKISLSFNLTDLKEQLLTNHISNLSSHLLCLIIISVLSLSIIGYFGALIYYFYIGMSIGFVSAYLMANYGLKGVLFSLTYNIIFKLIFIVILTFILIKLFDIVKNITGFLIYKKNDMLINNFRHNYLSIIILIIINTFIDFILGLSSNFILKIITNML
jgi:hypothetical protein